MELLNDLDVLDARNLDSYLADNDVDDTLHRLKLDCKRDVNRLTTYNPVKADKAKQEEQYLKQKLKWMNDESV